MSVVVRNERDKDYHFTDSESKRKRVLEPGVVTIISDRDLDQIPIPMRGPGEINVLHPTEASGDANRTLMDYYDPGGGQNEVRYLGLAQQSDTTSEPVWTIKRFDHSLFGAEWLITDIQVLDNAVWDDRATLGWV